MWRRKWLLTAGSLFRFYFSNEKMFSYEAMTNVIMPDIKPLPAIALQNDPAK